jgi:hypothetical protein
VLSCLTEHLLDIPGAEIPGVIYYPLILIYPIFSIMEKTDGIRNTACFYIIGKVSRYSILQ